MENIDLDMKMNDPQSFEEAKKLLDFLPDDEAKTNFLNAIAATLLNL